MPDNKGMILLPIARSAIAETLGMSCEASEDATWLQEEAACFITLMQKNNLRGCIGTLEAHRSLLEDVKHNANAAAFHDSRFSPLTSEELDITDIEISLLSPMQALQFSDERNALTQLQPGTDGVVFECGHHRSTFLPQVWKQLPDTNDFIAHLKTKAGLSADFWSDEVKLSRYTVNKWKERDFMAPTEEQSI
ncbi:MAG: AmmeMemoRadiSam system protein A [Gammaproteobacteria bacterium]|nr:MAG: AmmeMemoRadiSam system protein A [Gammaproteobacteria bacterium]